MKVLSVIVPCYNSEDYMENCIHSLLTGGPEVEIIIVDDGSTDRTAQIADKYQMDYPGVVNVIHQENGGHGEAVNTGLRHAAGLFFKVVDSDDWVSISAFNYVDNIFVYHPLPYVKTMYYLNVDFYRYYIGREDQSVNERVMIRRIDQQLKVNYHMIDDYNISNTQEVSNIKLRHYMRNYLEIIMVVSSIMLIRSKTAENLQKKYELWNYLKENDKRTYYWMKWSILGRSMNLPGKSGRKISEMAYYLAQKFVGFN